MAELASCSERTIANWLRKNDIEVRSDDQYQHKKYRRKKWLERQYIDKKKSMSEIAKLCNVEASTICKFVHKFNIPTRSKSEASQLLSPGGEYRNAEWLKQEYIEKDKSSIDIAEECDVAPGTISRWLRRYEIEKKEPYKNKDWVKKKYVEQEKTMLEIANEVGVGEGTIHRWIVEKHNIKPRPRGFEGKQVEKICEQCGKIYPVDLNEADNSHYCSKDCANLGAMLSQEEFLKRVKLIHGSKIYPIEEYKGINHYITWECQECGYRWEAKPANVISGQKRDCPRCIKKERLQQSKAKYENNIKDLPINLIGKYKGNKSQTLHKCEKCGRTFTVRPNDVITGQSANHGCPICSNAISDGEEKIADLLTNHTIDFQKEYTIPACKNEEPLPFDFAIFNEGGLVLLIEYQGKQHYEVIDYFDGQEGFEQRQKHDKIKHDYCKRNDIPLLEIPYTDKDRIPEILTREILNKELKPVQPRQLSLFNFG